MVVKCSFTNLGLSGLQFDVIPHGVTDKCCNQVSRVGHETKNHRQLMWAKEMHLPTEPEIDC